MALNIFGFGIVDDSGTVQDESTLFACDFDKIFTIGFHIGDTAGYQQGQGDITFYANLSAECGLSLGHIGLFKSVYGLSLLECRLSSPDGWPHHLPRKTIGVHPSSISASSNRFKVGQ